MPQLTIPRLGDSLKNLSVDAAEPSPGDLRFILKLEPDDRKPVITQLLQEQTAAIVDGQPVQIKARTVSGAGGVFDVAAFRIPA